MEKSKWTPEYTKEYHRAYREKNREKHMANSRVYYSKHQKELVAYRRKYVEENKELLREANLKIYVRDREGILEKKREYYFRNKDRIQRYKESTREHAKAVRKTRDKKNRKILSAKEALKLRTNIQFRLSKRLRIRLYYYLKSGKAGSAVRDLGCSLEELKSHLESLWELEMSWDNWSFKGWHIDHIKPLSSFDLTDREQFLEAVHFTNLQPLWARDNMSKGNKLTWKKN